MQIDKAFIDKRRDDLKKQMQQHMANAHACEGALLLLSQIECELKAPEPLAPEPESKDT